MGKEESIEKKNLSPSFLLAPVVISNIFVPSYSIYFYYHFLYLFRPSEMMMEEEDGGIVS